MPGTTIAVILGGGIGRRFGVLTSREQPKALLPLANAPLLSYAVEWVAAAGLPRAIVVVAGEAAAAAVARWVAEEYKGPLRLSVTAVAEECGTATALRCVLDELAGCAQVAVLSGDLVCDERLASLLARHRMTRAAATVLLARRRPSLAPELKVGRPPSGVDYIGLDPGRTTLLFCASSKAVGDRLRLSRGALAGGSLVLHSDLVDCQAYVFHPSCLALLADRPAFASLRRDLLPYLVRRQQARGGAAEPPTPAPPRPPPPAAAAAEPPSPAPPRSPPPPAAPRGAGFGGAAAAGWGPAEEAAPPFSRVAVLLAASSAYVARCDSLRAYLELNRELACATEGGHLTGLSLSRHDNYLQPGLELGAKAVIGPACVVGFGVRLGDRASVKRSVLGRRARLGPGAKLVNSVLHEEAAVEESAQLGGCVLGRGCTVGARANLRDCWVAAGATVAAGSEHRNEMLQ